MQPSSPSRLAASFVVVSFLLVAGCDQESRVRTTVPADGESGVDPQTTIRVTFSSAFNSNSDKQERLTDPENFRVYGEDGGRYGGKVQVMTASQAAVASGAVPAAAPTTGGLEAARATPSATESKDGNGKDSKKPGTGAGRTENDTLVFTLAPGTSFKLGERVRVEVGGGITVRGTRISTHRFGFWIRDDGNLGLLGELRVLSSFPRAEEVGVSARPRISAVFTKAVKQEGLAGGVVIRGEHSGLHAAGETVFPQREGEGKVLEVAQRLGAEDEFLPGEWVTVTLTDEIQGAVQAAASGSGPGAKTAEGLLGGLVGGGADGTVRLPPVSYRFQVQGGRVRGPWVKAASWGGGMEPLGVVAGDLRPIALGTEFAVLGGERVDLYSQRAPGVWEGVRLESPGGAGRVVDGAVSDLDGDGVGELVLLSTGEGRSLVSTYIVGAAGGLVEKGEPIEVPAVGARRLWLADLDNNGFTDLVITHPPQELTVVKDGVASRVATGEVTILEKSRGAPDLTKLNPNDPGSLLGALAFRRLDNPLGELSAVERLEVHDLDGDGKRELVVERRGEEGGGGELLLVQNRGHRGERFRFKVVRSLLGRGGRGALLARSWTGADVDGDRDVDLLAWDGEGALVYLNRNDPLTQDPEKPEARGLLYEEVLPVAAGLPGLGAGPPGLGARSVLPQVRDLNGDRALDVVLGGVGPSSLRVLLGVVGKALEFEEAVVGVGVGGRVVGVAAADADGDTGLDLIVVGDGSGSGAQVEVLRATEVEAPGAVFASAFRIDPELSAAVEGEVAVVVVGDIAEPWSGYTVALDFDEGKLGFVRYEEPVNFRGLASFTPCPNAKGEGCGGFASVKMGFTQNSRGTRGDGIVLGTFRFRPKAVSSAVRTSVFLAGELEGGDGKKVNNALVVIDGQSQSESRVELGGDAYVVSLSPPPPPVLELVACEVLGLEEGVFPARVAWRSPADALFSGFEVELDGELLQYLDGGARETQPFHLNTGGRHRVKLWGFGLDGEESASVECTLSTVFRPEVRCSTVVVNNLRRNRLSWSMVGEVDGFELEKNGSSYKTVSGNVFSDEDTKPSEGSGDVYEVSGVIREGGVEIEGPKGKCAVEDPTPERTEPPVELSISTLSRATAGEPLALRLHWKNGEAYDSLQLRVQTAGGVEVHREELSGTRTTFIYRGDPERGGVAPEIYRFSLVGVSGGVASGEGEAQSTAHPVLVPALPGEITCGGQGGEVVVSWERVWGGYSGLSLSVRGPGGRREVELGLGEREYREVVVPVGSYEYTLRARYEAALPPSLKPNPSSLERRCVQVYRPVLRLGSVETGVGLRKVLVAVRGDFYAGVRGLSFAVLLPEELRIELGDPEDPGTAVRLSGSHEGGVVEVKLGAGPVDEEGRGRQRLEVKVEGASYGAGKDQVLLWIVGRVDEDFARAGRYPLLFDGVAAMEPEGGVGAVEIETEYEPRGGAELAIRKRFLLVERAEARVTDTEPALIRVLGTIDTPAGFERAEDYRVLAFTVHLRWDPGLLELLPITESDQLETAVGGTGVYFFAKGAEFEKAKRAGDIAVAWIGLLGVEGFLIPRESAPLSQPLLYLKFKARAPESPAGAVARIELVKPPEGQNPSMLVPEVAPNDGPPVEAFFDGGVSILPVEDVPTLVSVSPAVGALAGGGEAVVNGFGFLAGVGRPEEELELRMVFRPPGVTPIERRAEWIAGREFKNNLLEFRVPSAGLAFPSLHATRFDVELRTPRGRSILAEGYQYEYLRVVGADRLSGGPAGGDLVGLVGYGFAPVLGGERDPRVEFRIRGAVPPAVYAAEVIEAQADGRKLWVRTPAMAGQSGKLADVAVTVPVLLDGEGRPVRWASDLLPQPWSVLAGPEVASVAPARAPTSGGTTVTIEVRGFPKPLDDGGAIEVRFGTALGTEVAAAGPTRVVARTPPSSVGKTALLVKHGGVQAELALGFEFFEPSPRVLGLTPAEGPSRGGSRVVVKTADLDGPGAPAVFFGSSPALVVSAAAGEATVTTPPHAPGAVEVKVTRGALSATLAGGYLYRDPRVIAVEPARGPTAGGAAVVVRVEDFGALGSPQEVQVKFGASSASVKAVAAGRIEVVTPAGTGPGPVDVTVAAGAYEATLRSAYAYEGAPVLAVTGVEPAVGSICGGETVLVRGAGFAAGLRVRFGGALSPAVRVLGPGEAEAATPAVPENAAQAAVGVSLNGSDFVETAGAFTFRDDRPEFIRGDADLDGARGVTDAVVIADVITGARASAPHEDAADANDDGFINTGDLVAITGFLFQGIGPLPPPGPAPGRDPTPDLLRGCRTPAP